MLRFVFAALLLIACTGCTDRTAPSFDEGRAFEDLKAQVAFGPRVPGSPAHDSCRDWIALSLHWLRLPS